MAFQRQASFVTQGGRQVHIADTRAQLSSYIKSPFQGSSPSLSRSAT